MSDRVDNNDNQRIKEMQEAQFRKKVDAEKKDQQARVTRSFNEVMSDKSRRKMAQQSVQNQQASEETQARGKRVLDQVRAQAKDTKQPAELARKAALSRATHGHLSKKRAVDGQEAQVAVNERVEDLVSKNEEDVNRIDKEIDREEELDTQRTEEQQYEHKAENAQPDRVDADGRGNKQQGRDRQGEGREERQAEGVEAAEGPRAAHHVKLPSDLIQKIVARLFQAISGDGRTSLQLDLKGDGLDGVTLKVASENGRVSCSFEGCSPELKTALRKGKPALTRALAKRGLKLVTLGVG